MALHSIPLLMPDGPPPLIGGVEVYLVEAHKVSDDAVGAVAESFRGLTVLVSFAADETDRRTLWTLRHALAFGLTVRWTGTDWPNQLAERVETGRPTLTTAVVYVGNSAVVVA